MSAVATVRPAPTPQPDGPAPRKRRKRAPAAGAAADCFTCSSHGFQCDRRRPYCSKCLDNGKECSGYKTQLTWNVGVASRGKLRGLSLPVAGTKKVAGAASVSRRGHRQSASINSAGTLDDTHVPPISVHSPESLQSNESTRQENHRSSPPLTSPFPQTWETPNYTPHSEPIFSHGLTIGTFSFPTSVPPLVSPVEHSFTPQFPHRGQMPAYDTPASEASSYSRPPPLSIPIPPPQQHSYIPFTPLDSAFDQLSPYPGLFFPRPDESYVRNDTYIPPDPYPAPSHPVHQAPAHDGDTVLEDDAEDIARDDSGTQMSLWNDAGQVATSPMGLGLRLHSFSSGLSIGSTPRLQYLINYYSEVISPVIVAFDGPDNPYRTHILRLAANSDALQHAIAALAASNLRQRRETGVLSTCKTDPARRSSIAHLTLSEAWHYDSLSPQDQAREETYFKNFAVQSLNRQLADPVERKKDSVLAVLLVLCLFHMCDTGVAKFRTQFAGVRKLLALRWQNDEPMSPQMKFFTSMFTWFDAITASVNDRESQFLSHHLDTSALGDYSWSLENLAGCDGSLFKVIAKLGRLNVLSQGKPVEENHTLVSRPVLPTPPAQLAHGSPPDSDYSRFDGNGWTTFSDEELFAKHTKEGPLEQFWREWREVRHALQVWTLPSPSHTSTLTAGQRDDLASISECFRYSALVYTERLANPTAPCTSPGIQRWVQQSLHYIRLVKSDVYLLWPLFVTGAECLRQDEREVIRSRCKDIQKDSGFINNASCLGLLEAVWLQMDQQGAEGEVGQGFRFTDIMKRADGQGEYIVV
ncbi:uncharacterized protein HMPREF1541_03708 [Cyphellophora europaea CBS 101466]|uniref:Zn(2)-C6 fungal-type domain-containing protein n=1 Tax=Cyphellophora europaea (strain CBS 101466) TaxID=1220924 RepID=W2RZ44_CYPE1|nr:uncharacterized protein HMPREF1541_03708 [Cyphellophora europaea CBS 101466]ETN41771.1 hypothetical protein HMPREF1541_03708 [Cyphellophora europaea CBS 101466]